MTDTPPAHISGLRGHLLERMAEFLREHAGDRHAGGTEVVAMLKRTKSNWKQVLDPNMLLELQHWLAHGGVAVPETRPGRGPMPEKLTFDQLAIAALERAYAIPPLDLAEVAVLVNGPASGAREMARVREIIAAAWET